MEVLAVVLLVFVERLRPDLYLRRAVAGLPGPRPALPLRVPVPVALAGVDLRRLSLRVTTVLIGYVLWRVYGPALSSDPYEGVNLLVGFYLAFLGLLVLGVVAATSGRDRDAELLAALPAGPRRRVLGWALLLAVAALLEYALLAVVRFGREEPAYPALLPDAWELAQGPLMLLGGGLLGLLLARLVPGWVAAPVGVVLGIAWVVTLSLGTSAALMLAPVTEWVQYREDGLIRLHPGDLGWHNAYLAGLCALGLIAALLREPGRRRGLLAGGAVALAATVAAGALALP